MQAQRNTGRRSYGTGNLYVRAGNWHGRWWVGDRRIKCKLGPVRRPGSRDGLTKAQAERELRRRIESVMPSAPAGERLTVEEVGGRLIDHLEALGRKRSTIEDYRSTLRVHLAPYFTREISKVTASEVEGFIARERRDGRAAKSIVNYLGLLHSIFAHAVRKGWASDNPVKSVDRPRTKQTTDIRFMDQAELEALLRTAEDGPLGQTDRTVYLVAAMTGLRQGELRALRWRDVDWTAGRIRVRQNLVRGEFDTPKSLRGSRAVPMADRVAGELERHFQRSLYQHDDDLVFPHPETGGPLERSRLLKRYKQALKRAGVRPVRFHDLRHTFGTRMAAAGVPLRTLQEWMGHRDFKTTLIYADYQPDDRREADLVEHAFRGPNSGPKLSETDGNSENLKAL